MMPYQSPNDIVSIEKVKGDGYANQQQVQQSLVTIFKIGRFHRQTTGLPSHRSTI